MSEALDEIKTLRNGGLVSGNATCITTKYLNKSLDIIEKDLNKYEKLKALIYEAYGYDEEEYLLFIKVIEDDK